jgi:hypothetical protein
MGSLRRAQQQQRPGERKLGVVGWWVPTQWRLLLPLWPLLQLLWLLRLPIVLLALALVQLLRLLLLLLALSG